MKAVSIDVVVPIFNEKDNILRLIKKLTDTLSGTFSKITVIFVDDGSIDGSEKEFDKIITTQDSLEAKYIRFSKNFGKDLAIKCGIDQSASDFCAVIDGDLQHPPGKIVTAYEKIVTGYNIVHILKSEYNVGRVYRRFGSWLFKALIKLLSGMPMNLTDYKLLDKKAVESIKNFKESCYYSAGVIDHIGLKSTHIYYEMDQRKFGETKFNLYTLFTLAFRSIVSISINPLRISIILGFCLSLFSLCFSLFILFEKLFFGQTIPGFTTIAVGMLFLGGIQLFFLGILGEYVGRTFIESKQRPQYIIEYQKHI